MSNSNDVVLRYKKETTYGTIATGNYSTLRDAGDTLRSVTGTVQSDELGNRRVKDVQRIDYKTEGALTCRWSYKSQDDLLMDALMWDGSDSWNTVVTLSLSASTTAQVASGTPAIVGAGASPPNFTSLGFVAGRWIRVKGFTTNGSEFYCRIIGITTTSTTNDTLLIDHHTAITESAITSGEIEMGGFIQDGSTARSWTFERDYGASAASNFRVFDGVVVNSLSLNMTAKGLVDLVANCIGQGETFFSSTQAGTPVAANSNRLIQGVDHVRACFIDGTSVSLSDWGMNISNNYRERNVFGTLGPASLGAGQFNFLVNMNGYYENNTQIAKYLAFTETSLAVKVRDASGNAYVIHSPQGQFTDASAMPEGNNTDVRSPIAYAAKQGSTYAYMVQIARWDV